jgi:hypothetical protein
MHNSEESVIFVAISLLTIALIFSLASSRLVQAMPVFGPAGEKKCTIDYSPFLPTRSCCWIDTDTEAYKKFCEVCTYQPDGSYGNCKTTEGPVVFAPKPPITNPPVSEQGPSSPPPPPPPNAISPPSSQNCSDGSTPDANGNCPTTTTNQQLAPPTSLGGSGASNNNNNNNPQPEHHHKSRGNDLLGQIGGGGELATRKANSPTPPACPDKGPIPPDCTLKPTPPACPDKGPIPPDCTLKPKF